VSLAVFASRIAGLFRESAFARMFGAGLVYDAFMLGFRIPNLTRDLFAEGALSSAFVPTFTDYLSRRSKEEAARLANLVATALIIVVGAICAIGIAFAPELVRLLAPGFVSVPGKFDLAVRMTRIMFPFLLLVALAAQAMGVLNACNRFGVPAMSSAFFNIGSLGFGILLGIGMGPWLGITPIEGMAWGVVAGGALQLAWQFPTLYKLGFRFKPALDWSDPGLSRILRLMVPAILGNAAVQINVMVNTNFASFVADPERGLDGPVSWLSYGFRFMQLPLGLFGVAIGSATLPAISRSAAAGRMDDFRHTLADSMKAVFLLTVPSAVGLAILGESIIGAIYQGGQFQVYDTEQTARALSCYAVGLIGYAALKVLTPAFYALNDSRTPMLVSFGSIVVNYGVAYTMVHGAGIRQNGLALATSGVAMFGFLVQFLLMRKRIHGIQGRSIAGEFLKIGAAAAVMAAMIALSTHLMRGWLGISQLARLADLAVSVPIGLAVYYTACKILGVAGIDMVLRSFTRPVQERLRRTP
jgi:putative peptidoglycan lipid II flippase